LEVISDVLKTEAVLIGNPKAQHMDLVALIKSRLEGYITATKYVLLVYNVPNDCLQAALEITPGKRSPTITSLDDGVSKSISALTSKTELHVVMDKLSKVGATDILVMQLSNSRM
jgi:ATP phosphoribosyltransferase